MVCVHYARDSMDATFLCSLLNDAGIATFADDPLMNLQAENPGIWVEEQDAERATEIIAAAAPAREAHTTQAEWVCPSCHERIEPQFTSCWNCQSARPDLPAADPQVSAAISFDVACRGCGYNVRGLMPGGRCPECGEWVLHTMLEQLHLGRPPVNPLLQLALDAHFDAEAERTGRPIALLMQVAHGWLRAIITPGLVEYPLHLRRGVLTKQFHAEFCRLASQYYDGAEAAQEGLAKLGVTRAAHVEAILADLLHGGLLLESEIAPPVSDDHDRP